MLKIIPFAHQLIKETAELGGHVVDATCGNGNDTLVLCRIVGPTGHVYAFDVQEQAIQATRDLLESNQQKHITYIHDSHANIDQYLPSAMIGLLSAAIFNLGYLPRSDKSIITKPESTLQAIEQLLRYLKKGGRIVIVVYHGHEGGSEEKDAIIKFVKALNQTHFSVLQYQFINQENNPPFVIAIEKNR